MIFMSGESAEKKTQETYLGHNMADAIKCKQYGRWPTGLERLESILGRQGNLLTVDDMLLLRQHQPSLYNTVRGMCYAVRTCQPNPEHESGGCTRKNKPGCQTFQFSSWDAHKPFFRRGTGNIGVCGACPIESVEGLRKINENTSFNKAVLELGIHRIKRITTTDVLLLEHNHPVGSTPNILIAENGHWLKFNKPSVLDEDAIERIFRELVECEGNRIDTNSEGKVIVHEPFIAPTLRHKDWQTVYSVEQDDDEWEISMTNFSNSRMRYFVGAIDPSRARHEFVERIPRGISHDHSVRIKVEDSLLVWLPSPTSSDADSWRERLGEISAKSYDEMTNIPSLARYVAISILGDYPGVFLFVKNGKHLLQGRESAHIKHFLEKHGQLLNSNTLIPKFRQDLDSILFFWQGDTDNGGNPEFVLDAGENLNLLLQTSRNSSTVEEDSDSDVFAVHHPIDLSFYDQKKQRYEVKAKLKPNEFGFAWFTMQFNLPGQYYLLFKNTGDHRERWIQITVLGDEQDGAPFNYQTQTSGFQSIEAGMPWGSPSKEVQKSLIKFNQDKLIQDLDGLDDVIKGILERGENVLLLGEIAEIARLVFHHHSVDFQGMKTIQMQSFERRIRSLIFNIKALFDLEVNSDYNLMRCLTSLGEFEYWQRKEGYENHHKLIGRNLYFSGSTCSGVDHDFIQIVDSRPTAVLKETMPSIYEDWESGLRFVDIEDWEQLDEKYEFEIHPNEKMIAPKPDLLISSFWNAVKSHAGPMPAANGWTERRWDPLELNLAGKRATMPSNRNRINSISEKLNQNKNVPGWLKKHNWNNLTSIGLEDNQKLFINIRYQTDVRVAEVDWEMWLGCLEIDSMEEKFVQLATRKSGSEDQPWIDDLGNVGDGGFRLPWLSNPRNALYDSAYLMREIVRSFATIVERGRGEKPHEDNTQLGNKGLPVWLFQKHVGDKGFVDSRVSALMKILAIKAPDVDDISAEELRKTINSRILTRFGWPVNED